MGLKIKIRFALFPRKCARCGKIIWFTRYIKLKFLSHDSSKKFKPIIYHKICFSETVIERHRR